MKFSHNFDWFPFFKEYGLDDPKLSPAEIIRRTHQKKIDVKRKLVWAGLITSIIPIFSYYTAFSRVTPEKMAASVNPAKMKRMVDQNKKKEEANKVEK
jgi:hypothetical protein